MRRYEPADPTTFTEEDPWDCDRLTVPMCVECRDELLGQPVMLTYDLALLSSLIRAAGLIEERRTSDRTKMAGRVELFHDVIRRGLEVLMDERQCALEPSEPMANYPHSSFWRPAGPFDEWYRGYEAWQREWQANRPVDPS